MKAKIGRYIYIIRDNALPDCKGTYGKIISISSRRIRFKISRWGDGSKATSDTITYYVNEKDEYKVFDNKDDLMVELL